MLKGVLHTFSVGAAPRFLALIEAITLVLLGALSGDFCNVAGLLHLAWQGRSTEETQSEQEKWKCLYVLGRFLGSHGDPSGVGLEKPPFSISCLVSVPLSPVNHASLDG